MKISNFYPCRRLHRGFTLIEVMISLVVAVIGIVAVLQLQGVFLQTASDSQKRALATAVAEKKLEELRGFDSISTTSSSLNSYEDIVSNTETETVATGSATYTFDLAWTVSPYTVSGGVISAASTAKGDFKNVTLSVSWEGNDVPVEMSTLIAAVNPQTSKFLEKSGLGGDRPEVDHTPGGVPDVIPIDVGDGKARETSKPLPDVDQSNESTEVRFTTVTYDTTDYKQVDAEEFITVNCFCVLNTTSTTGYTPYHHVYDSSTNSLDVEAGNIVTDVATGTPYTQGNFTQSKFCTRCCAQHHDSPSYDYAGNGVPRYDNTVTSGAHKHYKFNPSPPTAQTPTLAEAGNGDRYLEACRFRRVDGIFRLFPNWKMAEFNVMPNSYLASNASSSLAAYQQYVKETLQDEIFATSVATPLTGRDLTADNGEVNQLLSRGIYYDDMSYDAGWLNYMNNTVAASSALLAAQDWLQVVPFYELNMTLLSTWQSSSTAVATVTSDVIDTVEDDVNNYYGVYSRGAVTMAVSGTGSASITSYSKDDNTGILGNTYGNPSSYVGKDNRIRPSPTVLSSSLTATIQSCAPTCPITISGTIYKNQGQDLDTVGVSITGGTCTYTHIGNATTATFNCQVPYGSTGGKVVSPVTSLGAGYINPIVAVGGGNPAGTVTATTPGSAATDGTVTVNVTNQTGITGINFDLKK